MPENKCIIDSRYSRWLCNAEHFDGRDCSFSKKHMIAKNKYCYFYGLNEGGTCHERNARIEAVEKLIEKISEPDFVPPQEERHHEDAWDRY